MPTSTGAVLLVANYPSDVGYAWWLMENFWVVTANALQGQRRPCLLAYPKINAVPATIEQASIRLEEIDLRPRSLGAVLAGSRFIRRHRIRSVYLTDWPILSPLYLLWRILGVRSIVLHDHTPGDRPVARGPRALLKSALHALRLFSCDTYVGVSDYIRRRFVENGRVPEWRTHAVRNGIRPFACAGEGKEAVRARLGLRPGSTMVVLVSRATYYKGWDFAVRCAAELRRAAPDLDVEMVFCGDGPNLEEFRALAEQLGVARYTHFLGRRSDVREIVCAADVALHPSRGEALSLATLEFMCAGLPVVVPNRPSVCSIITDGESGLIYAADDAAAAARALAELAANHPLRASLGAKARQTMLTSYQLDRANDDFRSTVIPHL